MFIAPCACRLRFSTAFWHTMLRLICPLCALRLLCCCCRLRFSMAFWHTMRGDGSDPFGAPTKVCWSAAASGSWRLSGGNVLQHC